MEKIPHIAGAGYYAAHDPTPYFSAWRLMGLKVPYLTYLEDQGHEFGFHDPMNNPAATFPRFNDSQWVPCVREDDWDAYPWNPPGIFNREWLDSQGFPHSISSFYGDWSRALGIDMDDLFEMPAQEGVMAKPSWAEMQKWNVIAKAHALVQRSSYLETGSFGHCLAQKVQAEEEVEVLHHSGQMIRIKYGKIHEVLPAWQGLVSRWKEAGAFPNPVYIQSASQTDALAIKTVSEMDTILREAERVIVRARSVGAQLSANWQALSERLYDYRWVDAAYRPKDHKTLTLDQRLEVAKKIIAMEANKQQIVERAFRAGDG